MGKYILQQRGAYPKEYDTWKDSGFGSFETLEAARAALASRPFPSQWRIAEAYTVTRYKPVKL